MGHEAILHHLQQRVSTYRLLRRLGVPEDDPLVTGAANGLRQALARFEESISHVDDATRARLVREKLAGVDINALSLVAMMPM